jgi:hypothetical protein
MIDPSTTNGIEQFDKEIEWSKIVIKQTIIIASILFLMIISFYVGHKFGEAARIEKECVIKNVEP